MLGDAASTRQRSFVLAVSKGVGTFGGEIDGHAANAFDPGQGGFDPGHAACAGHPFDRHAYRGCGCAHNACTRHAHGVLPIGEYSTQGSLGLAIVGRPSAFVSGWLIGRLDAQRKGICRIRQVFREMAAKHLCQAVPDRGTALPGPTATSVTSVCLHDEARLWRNRRDAYFCNPRERCDLSVGWCLLLRSEEHIGVHIFHSQPSREGYLHCGIHHWWRPGNIDFPIAEVQKVVSNGLRDKAQSML